MDCQLIAFPISWTREKTKASATHGTKATRPEAPPSARVAKRGTAAAFPVGMRRAARGWVGVGGRTKGW